MEDLEFKRFCWISIGFHTALILFFSIVSKNHYSKLFDKQELNAGALNVMWATTVQSPPETKENKLPGPQIPIEVPPPTTPDAPKMVVPTDQKPVKKLTPQEEKKLQEDARRKAMADAVASMQGKAEKRPTPRMDNFPSVPNAPEGKKGLPASPEGGGGLGALMGDPTFQAYRNQVKQILSDNLIWVQQGSPQAEVVFRMDANGNILNPQITKSSGDTAFDSAALRAVRKSSPLPPPPASIIQPLLDQDFTINFQPKR